MFFSRLWWCLFFFCFHLDYLGEVTLHIRSSLGTVVLRLVFPSRFVFGPYHDDPSSLLRPSPFLLSVRRERRPDLSAPLSPLLGCRLTRCDSCVSPPYCLFSLLFEEALDASGLRPRLPCLADCCRFPPSFSPPCMFFLSSV